MLVLVGHTSFDHNINQKGSERITLGGAAFMGSVGGSLISPDLGMVTRVGEDYDMQVLLKLGIDLSGARQVFGKTTRFKLVYGYEDPLARDFTAEFNVGDEITPSDFPKKYLDQAKRIHIATMPPKQQGEFISALRARRPDVPLSIDTIEYFIDTQRDAVIDNLRRSDMVFLDGREFPKLPKETLAGKQLVLKLGKDGVRYLHEGNEIQVKAPYIENVVDKSGSGDVLAGAFLSLLDSGEDIPNSLRIACVIASESIKDFGVMHLLENPRLERYRRI